MSLTHKFNRHLAANWIPFALPGEQAGEDVTYLTGFPPQVYQKYFNTYRNHTKVIIALAIESQRLAKQSGVTTWNEKRSKKSK